MTSELFALLLSGIRQGVSLADLCVIHDVTFAEVLLYAKSVKAVPGEFEDVEFGHIPKTGLAALRDAQGGRTCYTSSNCPPEVMEAMCAATAQGVLMVDVLACVGMARTEFRRFKAKHPEFAELYEEAREEGIDAIAEETIQLADQHRALVQHGFKAQGSYEDHLDNVQRSKLQVDTRLRVLGCWRPTRYGNKVDVTSNGAAVMPITVTVVGVDPDAECTD